MGPQQILQSRLKAKKRLARPAVLLVALMVASVPIGCSLTPKEQAVGPALASFPPAAFTYHNYPFSIASTVNQFSAQPELGDPGSAKLRITGAATATLRASDTERVTAASPGRIELAFFTAPSNMPTDPATGVVAGGFAAECDGSIAGQPVCYLGAFSFDGPTGDLKTNTDVDVSYKSEKPSLFNPEHDSVGPTYEESAVKEISARIADKGFSFVNFVAVMVQGQIGSHPQWTNACQQKRVDWGTNVVAVFRSDGTPVPADQYSAFGICQLFPKRLSGV